MLPTTVFEHISRAHRLRTEIASDERRAGQRVPMRGTGNVHRIDAGRLGPSMNTRIKDISTTGIAMITPGKLALSGEFVLFVPTTDGLGYWTWCALRRRAELDRTCMLITAAFLKLLLPAQRIGVGTEINNLAWVDVEGDIIPSEREWKTAG